MTVDVAGEDTHEVDPSKGPTCTDLARVVDLRDGAEAARVVYAHRGTTTFDRPSVDDLLAAVDDART